MYEINNRDTFSLFAAEILSQLGNEFPIITNLDRQKIINKMVSSRIESIKRAKTQLETFKGIKQISELIEPDLPDDEKRRIDQSIKSAEITSRTKQDEETKIYQIYDGTLDFLCQENYIREIDGGYQLTSIGFSKLNREIEPGTRQSFLDKIPEAISPKKIVESLSTGAVTGYITTLLGASF